MLLSPQGEDRGNGPTDGSYRNTTFFPCDKYSGIFAAFSRVRPAVPSSLSPSVPKHSAQTEAEGLNVGDRVTYFIDEKCRHGMVLYLQGDSVKISTVSNIAFLFFTFVT